MSEGIQALSLSGVLTGCPQTCNMVCMAHIVLLQLSEKKSLLSQWRRPSIPHFRVLMSFETWQHTWASKIAQNSKMFQIP